MYKKLVYTLLLGFIWGLNAQNGDFKSQLDSIQKLRKLVENEELDLETRIDYAKSAVDLSEETEVDSTILYSNEKLVWIYLEDVKYFALSKKLIRKNLRQAYKLKDSLTASYLNHYLGYLFQRLKIQNDSSYYYYNKSINLLRNNKSPKSIIHQCGSLLNISSLQRDERDYISSQAISIKAINLILTYRENKESLDLLSDLYNLLGINLDYLEEYDQAIKYYERSLVYSNKIPNNLIGKLNAKINIAEVYKKIGNYKKVFGIYDELLKDENLFKKDASGYAIILTNIAYTKYLSRDKNIHEIDSLFTKAYGIFEDLQLPYELSASSNEMSEFYFSINEKEKALFYSEKAYIISKGAREYDEHLRALKQLSKLKEGEEGKQYLYEYIKLKDSLIDNERSNRNKFARIQFETDEYIKETKRLNTQNILISTIAGTVILILGLLYFIKRQNSKNNQLVFESEQQHSNQEIYNLLLNQQTKLEEGRLLERHRIAEDMHDGILSHLFGTRMGLGFLDIKGDNNTLNKYDKFINELQKVEDDIRNVSHELKKDAIFSKNNFETIIEQFLEQQSHLRHFKYEIIKKTPTLFEHIHDDNKVAIYRILQETIQNIIKHAKASKVILDFSLNTNTLKLDIIDNGIGFNTEKKHQGIGIKNIHSRVAKLEGTLKIESKSNIGTTIRISIPNIKPLNKQDV